MNQPFFTIIIPAYNCEKYIIDTLTSLQEQDYKAWECIVINDCSTDETEAKVQSFLVKDSRVKLISNETNQGVSASRNQGLALAIGKYVGFLDADDQYQPGLLMKVASQLEEGVDLLKFSLIERYYDSNGNIKRDIPIQLSNAIYTTKEEIVSFAIKAELLPAFGYAWTGFYSLNIIRENHVNFSTDLIVNEDFQFNVDYIRHASKVITIDFIGYIYARGNGNSLSSRNNIDFYGLSVIKTTNLLELYRIYQVSQPNLLDDIYWMYSRIILASLGRNSSRYSDYLSTWQRIHKDPIFKIYKSYQFGTLSSKQKIIVRLARHKNPRVVYGFIKAIQYVKDHMEDIFSLIKR